MDVLIGALVIALLVQSPAAPAAADTAHEAAVKAAFVFNFAKFTDWPSLAPDGPIVACVADDEDIAAALVTIVGGQTIGGHSIVVWHRTGDASWEGCHVLFVGAAATSRFAAAPAIRAQPVLTVSDVRGFAQRGGAIELYVERGRLRFAINIDAVERAGLRMSSRLLGLAKVVHDAPAR